jgi:hypothetical protein
MYWLIQKLLVGGWGDGRTVGQNFMIQHLLAQVLHPPKKSERQLLYNG